MIDVTGNMLVAAIALAGTSRVRVAQGAGLSETTVNKMCQCGTQPLCGNLTTLIRVERFINSKGVVFVERGVRLLKKPIPEHITNANPK